MIIDLEKMKKCMFLVNFDYFEIRIYVIVNKNSFQNRKLDLKQQNTVMRLKKSFKDF